jgi:hypothetical protein
MLRVAAAKLWRAHPMVNALRNRRRLQGIGIPLLCYICRQVFHQTRNKNREQQTGTATQVHECHRQKKYAT